ncbi:MAG TPA: hypothetical protein VD735_06070 [Candidatus Saccharimonadales bacterium]|nr:hypothetical protein [Candidatus Saccharimonadales bacterium]
MNEPFASILTVGGKSNSLGRANEVIALVVQDRQRIDELYACLFDDDAWVRMRAADALEKVCRQHPDWLLPYIDRLAAELSDSTQPSIQWHIAQIYSQVGLSDRQERVAIQWLKGLLATADIDWIVAANAMDTLAHFTREGAFPAAELIPLLQVQQQHKSSAVIKRATKLLAEQAA